MTCKPTEYKEIRPAASQVRLLARVYTFLSRYDRGLIKKENSELKKASIALRKRTVAIAPVCGDSMLQILSIRRGSKDIPSDEMISRQQRIVVANSVNFPWGT